MTHFYSFAFILHTPKATAKKQLCSLDGVVLLPKSNSQQAPSELGTPQQASQEACVKLHTVRFQSALIKTK